MTYNIIVMLVSGVQYNNLILVYIANWSAQLSPGITSIITHSYKFIFLMIRTFKIYSLSNFQIYSTVFLTMDFPGGSDGKEYTCNVADPGLIPGSGRHPGEGNAYPLQYSCVENSMDRGAWQATVHLATMSQTWQQLTFSLFFSLLIVVTLHNIPRTYLFYSC